MVSSIPSARLCAALGLPCFSSSSKRPQRLFGSTMVGRGIDVVHAGFGQMVLAFA